MCLIIATVIISSGVYILDYLIIVGQYQHLYFPISLKTYLEQYNLVLFHAVQLVNILIIYSI